MYEPSFISTNTLASYAKKITHHGRPAINITFNEHNDVPVTYTTSDSLSGQVSIKVPSTARFDQVHITLEGTIRTSVEHMTPVAAQTRTEASHTFLRLSMPIPDSEYPQPRIAEAGHTYTFPFHFVIPERLLPSSCTHDCSADHVHDAHLYLPPSAGDFDLSDDDLSPAMTKIAYAIKVRVIRIRETDTKAAVVAKSSRKIRVMPCIPEAPPLHIPADDKEYTLSAAKTLRKGMFKGKLGRLTASAAQTKAILVSPTSNSPPTIIATIYLRFDPAVPSAAPPRLGALSSRIKAHTFYGVRPLSNLATRTSMITSFDVSRGVYTTSTALATRCVANVTWTRHLGTPPQYARRDSGYSTSSENWGSILASPSACGPRRQREPRPSLDGGRAGGGGGAGSVGTTYYEAVVLLPLTLPRGKTWLPTFHSCLVSRVYLLDVNLTVHSPGAGMPSTTLSLHLPVQISTSVAADAEARGNVDTELGLGAAATAGVEEYLVPRVLEVPREEFIGGSLAMLGAGAGTDRLGNVGSVESGASAGSAGEGAGEITRGEVGDIEQPPGYEVFGAGRVTVRRAGGGVEASWVG
jgi:hypothetical protein